MLKSTFAISFRSAFSASLMNFSSSVSPDVGGTGSRLFFVLMIVRLGRSLFRSAYGSSNSRMAFDKSVEFLKVVRT